MILANSLGGMLSWNLAYERPDLVQSMMLMAPAGYAWDSIRDLMLKEWAPWYGMRNTQSALRCVEKRNEKMPQITVSTIKRRYPMIGLVTVLMRVMLL